MDLEQVKAAWQREKLRYRSEMSPKERAAAIRRKAEELERERKRALQKQLGLGLICLVLLAGRFDRHLPLISNLGLGIMVVCGAIALGAHYVLKRRLEESHRELPREEYLADKRRKILAQIKMLRNNTTWILVPALAGFLAWQIPSAHSKFAMVVLIGLTVIVCVITIWCIRRIVKKKLLPVLEDIDRELAEPSLTSDFSS
jgi:Na+/melibiose symporter-like transporter